MKSIIILAALSSAVAYADVHTDLMRNIQFQTEREIEFETESGDVEIDYSGMSYSYNSGVFLRNAQKASDMFPDFLESRGVAIPERCKDQQINVYDVTTEVLNQDAVYRTVNWGDSSRSQNYGERLLGMYDRGSASDSDATIYVDVNLYTMDRMRIISHEMYHFWHDQYCLSRKDIDSEEMARDFEAFYREHVNDREYRRPYLR
jgi:hypothetical protein